MFSQRFAKHCMAAAIGGAALLLGRAAIAAEAVVYTSNNVQTIDTALDIAKKAAPDLSIQKVTSGTGALMKRIEAEAGNPLGDVVWGAGFGTMAAFKQNFQPYESPEAKGVDAAFIGPDHLWTGTNAHVMIIMVNEKQLKGLEAPKTWKDLFDPKWKGKLIVGDPATSGSTYDQMYGIHQLYGQEGFNKLVANADISKSSAQIYKSVANGEYAVGVTMEYAAYAYVAGGQKEIRIVYPEDGVFVAPEAVAVIKNPKNGAAAAHKLYDVLLSKAVQEAELVHNFRRPTRADIDVAKLTKLPNLSDIKIEKTDPLKAAAEYDNIIAAWKKATEAAGK
ncbi:extracellular solute-binding protein [Parapusillimonas granuli]|uniref:Extracellular solute-binding protein n=1 Tax=Parapusillimonas granuli TaxID=380911 RepID=A0A853G1N3_9BURK|nr:extracellular solute-binding protein [Parapusillimonas granuli]MBB5213538.1 iron(III) transport system substrate-binding protein [Parapusillimonas granuli]NYT48376.1 extracellular solute-binding protein [Parapusillimonas granuli]